MFTSSTGPNASRPRSFLFSMRWFVVTALALLVFAQKTTAQSATTTTLSVTSGSSATTTVSAGTVVTLTATVVAGSTPVTPGQVAFCDASATHCEDMHRLAVTQLAASGTAVYKFRPGGGSHSYKAVFLGTHTYPKSSSNASSLDVTGPFISTTQIQDTYQSNSWTLTALVAGGLSAPSLSVPTGTVSFVDTSNANAVIATTDLSGSSISTSLSYRGDLPNAPGSILVSADVNGDGIPDVVMSDYLGQVTTCLGNGDGTFTQCPQSAPPNQSYYRFMSYALVADFNQDGIPDFLVWGTDYAFIYLGKGDGTFSLKTEIPTGTYGFVVRDVNGDGIPDIVISGFYGASYSRIYTYLGKGDGTFGAQNLVATIPYYATLAQAADFNGDGILDLLVTPGSANGSENAAILLGNSNGTFTALAGFNIGPSAEEPDDIVVADLNGDGIPDLAALVTETVPAGYKIPTVIQIMTGNGDGTFSDGASISPPDNIYATMVSGDFNADGILDIGVSYADSPTPQNFYLYLGNGDGTFSTANVNLANSSIPGFGVGEGQISVMDLNGDGLSDLVAPPFIALSQSGWTASASLANYTPSLGNHVIAATYPGDSNYEPSASGTVTFASAVATLSTPTPSTILPVGNVTFSWTTGVGVSQYQLLLGTTGAGSSNLYAGSPTTSTSATVTGIPLNGATIYATLLSEIDGSWYPIHYTYTEAQVAVLTSPVPGSKLSGSAVTFQWTPGSGITRYLINVGTKYAGSDDIYGSGITTATSAMVTGLPANGITVYVMVKSFILGTWYANYYTYTAAGSPTAPALITPTPGSKLGGSAVTFQWSQGSGPSAYLLNVGTKWPGADDIYGSGVTTATSASVSGLPTNGVNVYVLLRYKFNGVWTDLNYTYTAAGSITPPVMTTPAPGSVLSGSNVTFNWTQGTGVTAYALSVGTYGPGYYNIYSSPQLSTTFGTVPGIPTNGKPVYVTLRYRINGVWQTTGYTYTAQ